MTSFNDPENQPINLRNNIEEITRGYGCPEPEKGADSIEYISGIKYRVKIISTSAAFFASR